MRKHHEDIESNRAALQHGTEQVNRAFALAMASIAKINSASEHYAKQTESAMIETVEFVRGDA